MRDAEESREGVMAAKNGYEEGTQMSNKKKCSIQKANSMVSGL